MDKRLACQMEAGIIELDAERLMGDMTASVRIPWFIQSTINQYADRARAKTSEILRHIGIDPCLDVVVSQSGVSGKPDQVVTEGYNSGYYFLIRGRKGEEELHKIGGDYYCIETIIAPHNNNPEEGKAKIDHWLSLAEQYGL